MFWSGHEDGSRTGTENWALRVSVHPVKNSLKQRFVLACDAHGGGFPARQNEGVKRGIDVRTPPAFDDFHIHAEFCRRPSNGFSVFMASALKHSQTHTEHAHASMPFPISPTPIPRDNEGITACNSKTAIEPPLP
jgi:hypothetical protein